MHHLNCKALLYHGIITQKTGVETIFTHKLLLNFTFN